MLLQIKNYFTGERPPPPDSVTCHEIAEIKDRI
jgi:hypothetical protein